MEPEKADMIAKAELTTVDRENLVAAWKRYRARAHQVAKEIRDVESEMAFAIARGHDRNRAAKLYVANYLLRVGSGNTASEDFIRAAQTAAPGHEAHPIYFGSVWIGYAIADLALVDFEILEAAGIKPSNEAIAFDREYADDKNFDWR